MARTSTFHLYDRLLGGQLGPMLLAEDKSVEDIVFELRRDHDIKISLSTAHRWVAIAESEAKAAAS